MDGNQEALGTSLRCFSREVENGGTFHTFCEKEIAQLPLKNYKNSNIKNTTRRMPSAIWRISAEQNIPVYHELAGKQANGGNHLFAFFTINYFECITKQGKDLSRTGNSSELQGTKQRCQNTCELFAVQ